MGMELTLENIVEAVMNFSSSEEKYSTLDPTRDTVHDMVQDKMKKIGMGQNVLNCSQVIVDAIFEKSKHGVRK